MTEKPPAKRKAKTQRKSTTLVDDLLHSEIARRAYEESQALREDYARNPGKYSEDYYWLERDWLYQKERGFF